MEQSCSDFGNWLCVKSWEVTSWEGYERKKKTPLAIGHVSCLHSRLGISTYVLILAIGMVVWFAATSRLLVLHRADCKLYPLQALAAFWFLT